MSKTLTEEKIEAIRQDWMQMVLSGDEISEKHGISLDYPRKLARKRGWGPRPGKMSRKGPVAEWTPEICEQVKAYLKAGHSFGEVAKLMGNIFSRNAIIGKADREGWERNSPKQSARDQAVVRRRVSRSAPRVRPMVVQIPVELRKRPWEALQGSCPVSLFNRTGCKWPIDGEGETLFCNNAIHDDNANGWCERHMAMGLNFSRPKSKPSDLLRMARRAA